LMVQPNKATLTVGFRLVYGPKLAEK